mgnify:CR=1 FL=1
MGTPYTNTGVLATIHASDTWDVCAGVVRGWDVFADSNNAVSFTGSFVYTSPDQRVGWTTSWVTGPEAPYNNVNFRSLGPATLR